MSKLDKALLKLQSTPKPKDFTWDEAVSVMKNSGFKDVSKSGGSHHKFYNVEKDVYIHISRPHPQNELKSYQITNLIEGLKNAGIIDD